jgi:hypothetical protein
MADIGIRIGSLRQRDVRRAQENNKGNGQFHIFLSPANLA